ncbi:metal homeostatis protein BSD2 [Geosmithia morbida]|uniref:Metal homeostatis protein BSD2 n=1 Tax=Geosmithia morbida TaxID=1094350 RepID=A0A9P4YSL2_9HYPO|nr:metal homeostatis protein BSD2 [Geosmithia morbida]KAF4120896.1 metal homeostatis protein BSD2 [Geosmithia morbida]
MAGYERVNARDEDDYETTRLAPEHVPNSPPPSFHSRSPSPRRHDNQIQDPTLADAFDDDGDDSDDEVDDRQRLVRQNSSSLLHSTGASSITESHDSSSPSSTPPPASHVYDAPTAGSATRSQRIVGGGVASDGVFANMSARPDRQTTSEKDEQPPTYEQAAADAVPPYWETTILAPGLGGADEVYIDGLPVGSVFAFVLNGMISTSFTFVGFLLTYLLHSTHAAKNGSRAGLGVTLIQYGFYMRTSPASEIPSNMGGPDGYAAPDDPNSHNFDESDVTDSGDGLGDLAGLDWFSYALMVVGWFMLIKSTVDYLRARRHEQLVLQSPDRGLGIPIISTGESSERVV